MASSSDVGEIPKVSAKDIKYDETPIGRGGYGYVYRGVHKDLGTVAIKTMIADGLLPSRHQRIFKAEGKKLWELKHTSIVRLLGLIMEENNYSLILEYMHFGSLTAFRSDFVDIDWSLLVSVIRDVIHGMEYLHGPDPPILHLDLKSDNILINRRIRAKITDFGLSQWKTMTRTMTRSQGGEEKGRKGTVTHVPPEVWNNINTAPNKGYDVYSFGIVLWETVVGDRPFARVSDDIIPKAVLSGQRPDMTMIPSQCPREVMEMMTRCWTQQSDKRPTFAEMKVEIDALFEKLAPAVPEALGKLEKEIAGLYDAEDLGGDTAATADSESIFDAATKLTKPLTNLSTTSPQSVQMEDIGEEEDVPKTTGPPVPNGQSLPIVGLQDEAPSGPSRGASTTAASSSTSKAPAATGAGSASQAKPKPQAASTTATATATATSATTTATSGSSTSGATTAPAAAPAAAPGPFVMTEEQKKALRRVLRDPVGMLLMHKDAQLCKKVFGVDLELQKKIKDPKELLKLLEKDPLLRMELKRKGAEHVGWLFFPHRMKDEIRRKRPNRTPKPEAVNRMKTLREERQKRESKNTPKMDFDHKEKKSSGIASGLMGLFKKDKYKKMEKDPMSKYMDPYHDPYSDMMDMRRSMGMGSLAPDMSYKLKRALRDPQMIRYILREETPPRISPVDREVMDVIRDPDKLLEYMRQDPKLLDILVATDKEALMKLVARSRGPQSRHMRNMRGPRRMPGMYRGLEMDMMDMDLEDEMMMNPGRYERHKQTRELMDMLKNPGLPSSLMDPSSSSSSSRPSTVSRPPNTPPASTSAAASATNTAASNTGPSKVNTAANSNTTPGPGSKGPSPTKAATIPLKSSATESKDASKSATTNISQTGGSAIGAAVVGVVGAGVAGADNQKPQEPERREIKGLPDDHLVKRQENIKMPVQRHTDTEPLQTAYGFAKGFLNQTNSKSVPKTPTTNASNSQTASSTTSAASSTSGQGQTSTTQGQASGGTQNSSTGQGQSSQGQSSSGQGQSSSGQGQRPGSSTTSGAQPGSGTTFRAQPQFQNFNDPTSIHVELNADGSMSGDFNPLSLPAGVQFGENNVMVLNCDDDGNVSRNDISGAGSTRKRSTDYRSKFKKMSKKHRSVLGRGEEIDFDHVNLIADDIGPKWMDLAVEVEMKGEKLRDLKLEYKMNKGQDDYDYCMRVINDLLQRKPFFTLRDLILSLKEIDCQKTAIKLIEFVP